MTPGNLPPQLPQTGAPQPGQQDPNSAMGTKVSNYVGSGPPPACSACVHFDGKSQCDNQTVMGDPEVMGKVAPDGWCKFFRPDGNADEPEQEDPLSAAIARSNPFGPRQS